MRARVKAYKKKPSAISSENYHRKSRGGKLGNTHRKTREISSFVSSLIVDVREAL